MLCDVREKRRRAGENRYESREFKEAEKLRERRRQRSLEESAEKSAEKETRPVKRREVWKKRTAVVLPPPPPHPTPHYSAGSN